MQIQYSTMNKGRVNRNSSSNIVAFNGDNKNDKETDAVTNANINNNNNKKEVSEVEEKKEIGSGDTKQKTTFNETYQKSTNNRRKCFPSKHKQQLLQTHVTNRDFNSVYKANGSGGMDNCHNKISTGTMTVPSMTFYSPHYNTHQDIMVPQKQKGGGQYHYNFEFLHSVGMQMANATHHQSSVNNNNNNNQDGSPGLQLHKNGGDLRHSSSSSSCSSNGSNQTYRGKTSFGGPNNQQNTHLNNGFNRNSCQNNGTGGMYRNQKHGNWGNHQNYNNRQYYRSHSRYSLNNLSEMQNDSPSIRLREHSSIGNLVYVNTNIQQNSRSSSRSPTPNSTAHISRSDSLDSPEKSASINEANSIDSSPEANSIGLDSDSDSGASSNLNITNASVNSERSRISDRSSLSSSTTTCEMVYPVGNIACYPHFSSMDMTQMFGSVSPNYNSYPRVANTVCDTTKTPPVYYASQVNAPVGSFHHTNNGLQMFTNDPKLESINANGFYYDHGSLQQLPSKKRISEKQRSSNNPNQNTKHHGRPTSTMETSTNYITSNVNRNKHLMNHVIRLNPLAYGENPSHAFFPQDRYLHKSHLVFVKDPPSGVAFDRLSHEVWKKFLVAQQSEDLYRKKILLWKHLYTSIKRYFPRVGVYMVGSTIAGFGTDSSDVDMCIVDRSITPNCQRMESMAFLGKVRDEMMLNFGNVYRDFRVIHAKVPILKFNQIEDQIEVDLNYNNSVGIRNTHLLRCYTQMDWRLRPLALIVKMWAQFHNINSARDATISSYSLVLMVIHFLQCGVKPAVLPCLHKMHPEKFHPARDIIQIDMIEDIPSYKSENHQSLGDLFIGFLHYYSTFNYAEFAISVRTASILPIEQCRSAQSAKNDVTQWRTLCIEEPFELTNTARSVYDQYLFEHIKAIFHTSWMLLKESGSLDAVFKTPLFQPTHNIGLKPTLHIPDNSHLKTCQ